MFFSEASQLTSSITHEQSWAWRETEGQKSASSSRSDAAKAGATSEPAMPVCSRSHAALRASMPADAALATLAAGRPQPLPAPSPSPTFGYN